jgi:hypothetical protein
MQIDHIEIAKLELQRGDILLIRVPPNWTHEQHTAAHDAVKEAMRTVGVHGATVLTGTTDVEFQVIREG